MIATPVQQSRRAACCSAYLLHLHDTAYSDVHSCKPVRLQQWPSKAITLTSVRGQSLPAHCQITEPLTASTVVFAVQCQQACPSAIASAELGSMIEGQLSSASRSFETPGACKVQTGGLPERKTAYGKPVIPIWSSHTQLVTANKLQIPVPTIHPAQIGPTDSPLGSDQ